MRKESVGPETINARPSAEKFKSNSHWWRPFAALALAVIYSVVYNEDQKASNSAVKFKNYSPGPETLSQTNILPSEKMFDDLVIGSVTINQLLQQPDKQLEVNLNQDLQVANSNSDGHELSDNQEVRIASNPQTSEVISQASAVRSWLEAAGWPEELIPQAEKVVSCESKNKPDEINHAENPNETSYGLFQLVRLWFDYAGEDFENWSNPIVNARVAYKVYLYDIDRGQAPWNQWGCKP